VDTGRHDLTVNGTPGTGDHWPGWTAAAGKRAIAGGNPAWFRWRVAGPGLARRDGVMGSWVGCRCSPARAGPAASGWLTWCGYCGRLDRS